MPVWDHHFGRALEASGVAGRRRVLPSAAPGLDFSSNDYLGLSRDPRLAARAAAWGARDGTGAGASRLVREAGLCRGIEAKIAALKGAPAALLFASGWQANAAVIPALLRAARAPVFADRLIHASLHHGIAAAGARQHRFRHNDLDHLDRLLAAHGPGLVVTESVFGMDGDRADLPALRGLADRHGAFLFVDDAHATGVLGPRGAGLAAGADLVMGTFSKALGGFGAYVAGSAVLCDYLVNACSGFIHTTGLPPTVLGAIDAALDLLPALDDARARVAGHADRLRRALAVLGVDTGASSTQIVPAIVGGEAASLALSAALRARGIGAAAIRPPTVPAGTSRLRLALTASHTDEDVDRLIAALRDTWPRP